MYVHGIEVTKNQQQACIDAMNGKFKAADIEAAAIAAGVPKFVSMGKFQMQEYLASRVADRLLQKQRKAGVIKREGNHWIATGK